MKNLCLVPLLLASALSAQTAPPLSKLVETYCGDCHDGTTRTPSAVLERLDVSRIAENPGLWSRAYREIQAGTMPPYGAPRPDRATATAMLTSVEHEMKIESKPQPHIDDAVLATRLAALLWDSDPDAPLLDDARQKRLNDPATLDRQIRRMFADPRAESFITRFFSPWLQLDQLSKADPDRKYFPDYEPSLRDALAKETQLFLLSQLRDNRDPIELWTANYTFLNEQLAKHYGIANVSGKEFQRVTLPSSERNGLLGQGSIMMVTSRHQHGADAGFTTPATRGRWVLAHFLGVPTPTPAPNAKPVKPEFPITPQTRVLPEQPCVNCHRAFFPLGYGLENLDGIGHWRTQDQMGQVDASGALVDGTRFNGVVEMRNALLNYPDAFRTNVTERLLAWKSTGKAGPMTATPETFIQARRILGKTPKPSWSELIAAVLKSNE